MRKKKNRRKPISFDTTLRNPRRIPQFISVLKKFEGEILNDDIALYLMAEIINKKIFEPSLSTLGTYVKHYNGKFNFEADDQSDGAQDKVNRYYNEWLENEANKTDIDKILYLLKNTITKHKEAGYKGGWESRLHTQYNFLNELGFVVVSKDKEIKISANGNLMISQYRDGYPISDIYDETQEESAFLNAFARYQINNPYRSNTINVNFFPLVLNVIKYLDTKYKRPGISRSDLPFIIAWGNDDYKTLSEFIYKFRKKYGYNVSNEVIYSYAIGLMERELDINNIEPASEAFIKEKETDYKFSKIIKETPDEIVRKLRLTKLISLRGGGSFIDINSLEKEKVNHVLINYASNKEFGDPEEYFEFMGKVDSFLVYDAQEEETEFEIGIKEKTIIKWAEDNDWKTLKEELVNCTKTKGQAKNEILKFIKETVRLEFLSAIVIKKALPNLKVIPNYKVDDQGIPFNTAGGTNKNSIGSDIDVYENDIHAIVEPTLSNSRSFQVEHELPSIRSHIFGTNKKDHYEGNKYKNWFALFIAPNIHREVGDQIAVYKQVNGVEIYPWNAEDFIDFSQNVKSIEDYKIIREYAEPQKML